MANIYQKDWFPPQAVGEMKPLKSRRLNVLLERVIYAPAARFYWLV